MVGTTARRGGQESLTAYSFAPAEAELAARELHQACDFLESVYLATCNRMEVVFLCKKGVGVSEYRRRLYDFFVQRGKLPSVAHRQAAALALHAYEKDGAAEHLFCVAAGLDSLSLGDAQILGQVKAALQQAQNLGLAGPHLSMVFDEAFQAAKRVRTRTALGAKPVSMLSLAFGIMDERLAKGPSLLAVVGAGEMSRQCGEHLRGRANLDLLFVNRTPSKAADLASQFGGRWMALHDFLATPGNVDVLVTATSSREPLFGESFFSALTGASPVVIDLAIPRDTDPIAAAARGADLHDIDRLKQRADQNRRAREAEMAEARVVVDEALDALRRRVFDRDLGPVLRDLRVHGQGATEELLQQLFSNGLAHLPEDDREQVRRFGQQLVNRLLHVPSVGLKHLAHQHGIEAVEAFLVGLRDEHSERR
jgi:glutamyl-tRNA reductase